MNKDEEGKVGYGRPPRSGQFKKGRSGNPRGRPRKPKPRPIRFSDIPSGGFREAEAYRPLKILENGQPVNLTAIQAVDRAAYSLAIKGNRLQQKWLLERTEREEKEAFALKVARYSRLETHKRKGEQILAECERKGVAYPAEFLPHPDDIVLDPATGEVSVNGPSTPEDVICCEHTVALRDYLLLRSAHAGKTGEGRWFGAGERSVCSYHLIATLFDKSLPRRYRWRAGIEQSLLVEYEHLPRRQREKRIVAEQTHLIETMPRPLALPPKIQQSFAAEIRQIFGADWLSLPGKGSAGAKPAKT